MKTYRPQEKGAASLPAGPREELSTQTKIATLTTDLQAVEPGGFPLDALPPAARDMAAEVSRVYGVPPELPGMATLATLGAACGKAFKLTGAVNGCENFANLYVFTGAPRGTGKSCVREIVRPILDVSAEMEKHHRAQVLPGMKAKKAIATKEQEIVLKALGKGGLAPHERLDAERELRTLQEKLDALEIQLAASPALWAANATSEALAALLAVSGETLLIYSAEGGEVARVFAGKYRRDEKGDFDLLLSGYTGETVRVSRKGSPPLSLESPCLSLLLAVQPPILRELFANREAVERGLLTRTLCFICESELREDDGTVDVVSEDVRCRWYESVSRILDARQRSTDTTSIIQCAPDAREVLREFHNESIALRKGEFADIQGELSRWRENACRAALALCIGDAPDARTLTADQAARAVALTRWAQLSMLALLTAGRQVERMKLAERVREILNGAGGRMTLRDLKARHGVEHGEARLLAGWMPRVFAVECNKGERGRPSESIRFVNLPPE